MLVLKRKLGQEIVIGEHIRVRILSVSGERIRLGIDAPEDIRVVRGELLIPCESIRVPEAFHVDR